MRIAALQFAPVWEDRAQSFAKVERFAAVAARGGADLLVLGEMFATGFSLCPARTAEPQDGPTTAFLRGLARRFHLAVLGGLVLEGPNGRGRNAALAIDRTGQALSLYVKTHLIALLGEDRHHTPGDGPKPFRIGGFEAACFICYDLRFPELFRLVASRSGLVFVIASWPAARQQHWDVLLQARAIENQCYLVGVNRVGEGGGLEYTGGSAIYSPLGEPLARAGTGEELLWADLDPGTVDDVRTRLPFLKDRIF